MTALRFSLITEREILDLPRAAGTLILCLLISAWLHLVFFTVWETLADGGPAPFRLEISIPPPLEIVVTLDEEEPPPPAGPIADTMETAAALEIDSDLTQALLAPEPEGEEAVPSPPVTVEPEAPRFKSYNTAVRMAVRAKWLDPPEARINFRPGRLVVNITIGRDGTLLRFVVLESTGNAILDHAGLEALRAAAPFPPFPPEIAVFSQLEITFKFDYQAGYVRHKGR